MPESPATERFQTPDGKQWAVAGTNSANERYFVPAGTDPATVRTTFWINEADLTEALGPLSPVTNTERSAA